MAVDFSWASCQSHWASMPVSARRGICAGVLLIFSVMTLDKVVEHPIFFMPKVMNSNWFMQEVLILSVMTFKLCRAPAAGPFGRCHSGESLYYKRTCPFAPRDKRCLPAQSSSMHAQVFVCIGWMCRLGWFGS